MKAPQNNFTLIYLPCPVPVAGIQQQWVYFQRQKGNSFCLFPPSLILWFNRYPGCQLGLIAAAGVERFWDNSNKEESCDSSLTSCRVGPWDWTLYTSTTRGRANEIRSLWGAGTCLIRTDHNTENHIAIHFPRKRNLTFASLDLSLLWEDTKVFPNYIGEKNSMLMPCLTETVGESYAQWNKIFITLF